MIVTWFGHSQLFVNSTTSTALVNPWFEDPARVGDESWVRYPPAAFGDATMSPKPDLVLLSDERADHASEATLRQFLKPTHFFALENDTLKARLKSLGLKNVTWLRDRQMKEVAGGLLVTFFGKSLLLEDIEANVRVFVGDDGDDLSAYAEAEVVDLAFLTFAGPTRDAGLTRFIEAMTLLKPAEAVPFGSGYVVSDVALAQKTFETRLTPDEALRLSVTRANELGVKLLHMEPGDEWSLEAGVIRKGLAREWPNDAASVLKYLTP